MAVDYMLNIMVKVLKGIRTHNFLKDDRFKAKRPIFVKAIFFSPFFTLFTVLALRTFFSQLGETARGALLKLVACLNQGFSEEMMC